MSQFTFKTYISDDKVCGLPRLHSKNKTFATVSIKTTQDQKSGVNLRWSWAEINFKEGILAPKKTLINFIILSLDHQRAIQKGIQSQLA